MRPAEQFSPGGRTREISAFRVRLAAHRVKRERCPKCKSLAARDTPDGEARVCDYHLIEARQIALD